MHYKKYPIQIWFLDDDLQISAQSLNNKLLNKTIAGCFQALVSTYLYFYGIRNVKFFKHYFSKENYQESMDKWFPLWPLRVQPKFQGYGTRQSKWCRKCKEHFDYVKRYMDILCQEYEYRFCKVHGMQKFIEWLEFDAPKLNIPEGRLSKITLEWKVLNPRYRRKNIVEGYKLQYKAVLQNDGINMNDFTKRDIPEWLLVKEDNWMR